MRERITLICSKCGNTFQVADVTKWKWDKRGITEYICKPCKNNMHKKEIEDRNNSIIDVKCTMCGNLFKLKYSTYQDRIWKKARMICDDCIKKTSSEFWKERYKNLSDEEKLAWSQRTKDQLARRTPEEWEAVNRKLHETLNNRTQEERDAISQKLKDHWNNLPEDERKRRSEKLANEGRKYMASLSEEEKAEKLSKLLDGLAEYYRDLSPEERADRNKQLAESARKYWRNITEEQYEIYYNNRMQGIRDFYDKFWIIGPKTENEFKGILDKHCIPYETQKSNTTKHPDFDKLFPCNQATGRDIVKYKHKWDFLIHLKDRDIFVDIDGASHDPKQMDFIRDGKNFKECDNIAFNDSKRPYQTDGLDAYVIECFDSKLKDDSKVKKINSDTEFTFKQFIAFLDVSNTSKEELNSAIKEVIHEKIRR